MKNFDEIHEILEIMRQHELSEFELERGDLKIKLKKGGAMAPPPAPAAPAVVPAPVGGGPSLPTPPATQAASAGPEPDGLELAVVKSPIVGTFYRTSEPGAPNLVEVGSTVKKGQVLCIIEAMKLMNEIESEYDGEVQTVYVENGLPVEYGERLFAIKVK